MPSSPDIQRDDPRTAADRAPRRRLPEPGVSRGARDESGIALLEVLISALLVALISVAVLSGFTGADRATADARAHAQAVLCAQESEERLRGMSELQLNTLAITPETPRKLNEQCQEWKSGETGTIFTLNATATYVTASTGANASCSAAHSTDDYIRTTSSVTWSALGEREPVKESSIVTTPSGASLIAKVKNQKEEPVAGAIVTLTSATGSEVDRVVTTGSTGCALFGTLPDGELKLTVEKPGWVGPEGATKQEQIESVATGNPTPEAEFHVAEPGSIIVKFRGCTASCTSSNPTWTTEHVDNFVASQTEIKRPITYDLAGAVGTYVEQLTLSGLYPFATSPYVLYAGECAANNPAGVVTGYVDEHATVEAGITPTRAVYVEAPPLNLKVYAGNVTSGTHATLAKGAVVKITDSSSCQGVVPNNMSSAPSLVHEQKTTAEGTLEDPGMPYGSGFGLCVSEYTGGKYRIYQTTFSITSSSGYTIPAIALEATGAGYTTSNSAGC